MNDPNTGPQPWIDPALEARVVAAVLGESSAFESAELDQLVADNPELALFKRRIEAVHGLVGPAVKPHQPQLQLSADRRKKLLETLGVPSVEVPKKIRPFTLPRPAWWTSATVIRAAACLMIGGIFWIFSGVVIFQSQKEAPDFEGGDGGFVQLAPTSSSMPALAETSAAVGSPGSASLGLSGPSIATLPVPMARPASTPSSGEMLFAANGLAQESAEDLLASPATVINSGAAVVASADLEPFSNGLSDLEKQADTNRSQAARGKRREMSFREEVVVAEEVFEELEQAPEDLVASAPMAEQLEEARSLTESNVQPKPIAEIKTFATGWGKGGGAGIAEKSARQDEIAVGRELRESDRVSEIVPLPTEAPMEDSLLRSYTFAEVEEQPASAQTTFSSKDGDVGFDGFINYGEPVNTLDKKDRDETGLKKSKQAERAKNSDKTLQSLPPQKSLEGQEKLKESRKNSDENELFRQETSAAEQPFSTFSLHVSDVSFQLAKDSLEQGRMPETERIRPEEFYNAFDYNDPSPGSEEAVACRIEQGAHPFLQQRDLVRIAVKVAAAGRAAGQPLRLALLLDTSGSMEREDRAESVRRALLTLSSLLGPDDRVTLIGFARTPRLLAEQVPGDQAASLVEIAAATPSEGGTNLEEALALASELATKQFLPTAQNRIVLLTDGAANLGDANPQALAQQIESTRQKGISFDACGVGANGLNDEMLEALTRKGDGRYYFLNRPDDADAGFARQLAGALRPAAENVKVQVFFNPARVQSYRLIGFEKHLLKKEDFRNDQVQAAELSAEEAGIALYQIETRPNGEGDVGQVFVRFRDPASGNMVECSWPIGYNPNQPAFDQASPSLQLAGTAALLAERLRGDTRMDLNTLAPVLNRLRSEYPNQTRVNELIRMFEQIRQ